MRYMTNQILFFKEFLIMKMSKCSIHFMKITLFRYYCKIQTPKAPAIHVEIKIEIEALLCVRNVNLQDVFHFTSRVDCHSSQNIVTTLTTCTLIEMLVRYDSWLYLYRFTRWTLCILVTRIIGLSKRWFVETYCK